MIAPLNPLWQNLSITANSYIGISSISHSPPAVFVHADVRSFGRRPTCTLHPCSNRGSRAWGRGSPGTSQSGYKRLFPGDLADAPGHTSLAERHRGFPFFFLQTKKPGQTTVCPGFSLHHNFISGCGSCVCSDISCRLETRYSILVLAFSMAFNWLLINSGPFLSR